MSLNILYEGVSIMNGLEIGIGNEYLNYIIGTNCRVL